MKILRNKKFLHRNGARLWRAWSPANLPHASDVIEVLDVTGLKIVGWRACELWRCTYETQISCVSGMMMVLVREYGRSYMYIECPSRAIWHARGTTRRTVCITKAELIRLIESRRVANWQVFDCYQRNAMDELPTVWRNYKPPRDKS